MLEPLLMLTVLNCFFMFSSTVTTCAFWWQYRRHRQNCSSDAEPASKIKLKKSKSYEKSDLRNDEKHTTGHNVHYVGNKSSSGKYEKSKSRTPKQSKRDKLAKSLGMPTMRPSPGEALEETMDRVPKTLEKLASTRDVRQGAISPSSEAKSTIVMEVSTVQKVVQIIDNDREHQHGWMPRETVTYRLSPENERRVEIVVRGRSEERIRSMEKD